MGTCCCSRTDAMPLNTARNIDTKQETKDPLINTSDSDQSLEGIQVELETSTLIAYILSDELTTHDLTEIWDNVDQYHTNQIIVNKELQKIFRGIIYNYIKLKTGKKANAIKTDESDTVDALSYILSQHFDSILANYKYEDDVMNKHFFIDNFKRYIAEPSPDTEEEQIQPAFTMDPVIPKAAPKEDVFDMLTFISTSSTVKSDVDFMVDLTVTTLRDAMSAPQKQRGKKVGQILASLTESERIAVRSYYGGNNNESLQEALKQNFNGNLLSILTQLCRSNAQNDAECIESSRNKLNVNWSVINEILMTKTNSQLSDIKTAYHNRFGRNLLKPLLQSFNDTGSYAHLLKSVLSDNPNKQREEIHPGDLKIKKIRDDAKILYHILENTKGKAHKPKVIDMLCRRSWAHIALLCKEYGKKSKYDLKTMIEKKFGKKSGHGLHKIIDISRNRHSCFAQLLFQSMKGISVNDDMLIRIIVSRSEIDLGEISAEFSRKYGNGKTLLQFIRGNIRKGTYRDILLRICAIRDHVLSELQSESLSRIYDDDDDVKVQEDSIKSLYSRSQSDVDGDQKDMGPGIPWDEYIRSSPTIKPYSDFGAHITAQELIAVVIDKKQHTAAKKLLIQTLTMIDNKQRQELKKAFYDLHPDRVDLAEATQNTLRKGKTMIVMLGLLQRPAEFHCFWIKQAIKSKKVELLIEILCSLSNLEIKKVQDLYRKQQGQKLNDGIDQIIKKKPAKSLLYKILECKRLENTKPDKKLCKIHLREIGKLLKEKNQKQCKLFFAKLFVENSYTQINYEINKFNTASEHTLNSVVKKIMGSGPSGVIIENIIKIATNRYGYFAEKLRDAMKGITTSEQVLIRILISRSEKDLGDIVQYFAEENYGDGKTLKQWIQNSFKKGSFQKSLLRIAHLSDDIDHDDGTDDEEYESMTETERERVHTAQIVQSKSAYSYGKKRSATLPNDQEDLPLHNSQSDKREKQRVSIKISTPRDVAEEIAKSKSPESVEKKYDPYDVNEKAFGTFIIEKVNEKTATRLMQHLKSGKKNVDNNDVISASQIIHVLLFACVLYLKYTEKTEKRTEVKVDKKKLKQSLIPAFNWMLENKLKSEYNVQKVVKKSDYKKLGKWLQEYYDTKQ